MKGMILAAGFGSRLGEITKNTHKSLVDIGGTTPLAEVFSRFQQVGVTEVAINLHYLGQQVEQYVRARDCYGMTVHFVYEAEILGTGGGVKNCQDFLKGDEPFFVYNSDVFCDLDLADLWEAHQKTRPLSTIVTADYKTSRPILLERSSGKLVGWVDGSERGELRVCQVEAVDYRGFCGIHLIESTFFRYLAMFSGQIAFFSPYLEAARMGERILGYDLGDLFWIDMGTPDTLGQLRNKLQGRTTNGQ